MDRKLYLYVVLSVLMSMPLIMPRLANADTSEQQGMKITGEVTSVKSGLVTVKTPVGTLTLNENASRRHGHGLHKVGDELTIWVNENNTVIDVHPKGEQGTHRFITGKMIYAGKMKKEVKLWTPEGEKTFPLERLEVKTKSIEEGALITVELNEAGTVIDIGRAK
jgi:hypothetical protein